MRLCELKEKDVINVCDCRCLGHVQDLILDECNGCVQALIILGPARFFGCFCRDFEYVIPWCDVVRIGPDIVLVNVSIDKIKHKRVT